MFFDPQAMAYLYRWWDQHVGIPILPTKPEWPHMTSTFKPLWVEILAMPVGKVIDVSVIGWAADESCQAVVVDWTASTRVPHVTIGTAPGVTPYQSNVLLAEGWNKVRGPTLEGTVGYLLGGKPMFTLPD